MLHYFQKQKRDEQKIGNMSDIFWKAIATASIWVMSFVMIVIGSIFVAPVMGEDFLGFLFMVMAAAIVTSGFVWNWGRLPEDAKNNRRKQRREQRKEKRDKNDEEYYDLYLGNAAQGKRKNNDRLAEALRQLSDDELVRLKDGIATGKIDEDDLEDALEDMLYDD